MSPEESVGRVESLLIGLAARRDIGSLRRVVPFLIVASGARYAELGPGLQREWRSFLREIGASVADDAKKIARKADEYFEKNPVPLEIHAAVHSAVAASNRSTALEAAAQRSQGELVRSAPKVDEVSQRRRPLPLRMPKTFR